MTIFIRQAEASEAEQLTQIALNSKAHWGYSEEFMLACEAELTVTPAKIMSDHFAYAVILSGDDIQGFYALESLSESEVELEALFIDPNAMGKGLGKALMSHAVDKARQAGFAAMVIQSDPNADDFYTAMGCEPISKKESLSIPGRYLTVFKYKLNDT